MLLLSFIITINWHRIPSIASSNSSPNVERPIVLGYSNWAGWWIWGITESEGLFAKHGANVELRWCDDYTKSMEDLAAGYLDGNCQTPNDTISFVFTIEENLAAFSEGNDMKSLLYAAQKIKDFLQNNLKSINKPPNLTKIFNKSFVNNYVLQ